MAALARCDPIHPERSMEIDALRAICRISYSGYMYDHTQIRLECKKSVSAHDVHCTLNEYTKVLGMCIQ